MSQNDIRYGRKAEDRLKNYVESFKGNLSKITRRLARHERAETIDVRHVDNAYEALIRCGLDRLPFWQRPQLKITISGFLIAAALATPDFAPYLAGENQLLQNVLFWAGVIIFSTIAIGIYIWGWLQNRV